MPGAYMPPQKKKPHKEALPPPVRDKHGNLPGHEPFHNPSPPNSPAPVGGGKTIKITTEQLVDWAKIFDNASTKLNNVGDLMGTIKVEPGYFQEADMVRQMVSQFNSSFIPNMRSLADAHQYVSRALTLTAQTFDNTEKVNLDQNTDLTDMISSMTKGLTGLKPIPTNHPKTPGSS
jgi:hypothetical protein